MRIGTLNRQILGIALPAIVANVTVPLLGMVDTAIVGHLGNSSFIGSIAVGGLVFSVVYWLFGFLRAGTSGPTAQAFGGGNSDRIKAIFLRSLFFALIIALLLILFQKPLADIAFGWLNASAEVERWACLYFSILIWGAPAVMLTTAFAGWFIGLQDTRATMTVSIVQNVVNIPVSLFFVFVLGMKVEGVALGTLVAQYAGLLTAVLLRHFRYRSYCSLPEREKVFCLSAISRFFAVNRDIFLRTLCLVAVTTWFTRAGAQMGDLVLAANTLLLQLFYLFSYVMDGFANAGEALSGKFHGASQPRQFSKTVGSLFLWGIVLTLFFTMLYWVGGAPFLGLFSNDTSVVEKAVEFLPWALAVPVCGFAAFLWDGVFIGTTSTRSMLLSMIIATIVFFALWYSLKDSLQNNGLWLAFVSYLLVRGLAQTAFYPLILHKVKRGQK